jgi:hypothetical protein
LGSVTDSPMCGTAKKLQVCSVSIDWWPRYTLHEIVIEGAYRAELPKIALCPMPGYSTTARKFADIMAVGGTLPRWQRDAFLQAVANEAWTRISGTLAERAVLDRGGRRLPLDFRPRLFSRPAAGASGVSGAGVGLIRRWSIIPLPCRWSGSPDQGVFRPSPGGPFPSDRGSSVGPDEQ